MTKHYLIVLLLLLAVNATATDYNPFACDVIDISLNGPSAPGYLPAPGQRINVPDFNDPNKALGAPSSGGTMTPNNGSVVTLGGFGGQIVLAFDHDVLDDPANPMGLDAIVFGNAMWLWGNPNIHWAELATIEIMPELNGNNTPGDHPSEKWYLIPGSNLTDNSSFKTKNWSDEQDGYPSYVNWPDSYKTSGFELSPEFQTISNYNFVFMNPGYDNDPNSEGLWGYAQYSPTVRLGDRNGDNITTGFGDDPNIATGIFYTTPDDPRIVGMTPGSGGGDAFDVAWAVDPVTFTSANLEAFRYIRLTTAVDRNLGVLGEVSAEIDAVADVRPTGDINGDGDVDLADLNLLAIAWLSVWGQPAFNSAADLKLDNKIDMADFEKFSWGYANDK